MKLSPRLAAVAKLAGAGESVIDVGTDHGLLPVYFVREGLFSRVAASDIRQGPLSSARRTAAEAGVEGEIDFYLSDGLRDVPGTFATVVIAGMGGETMSGIVSACPWIGGASLVLQPQSKLEEICRCLDRLGFVCRGAVLAREGERLYPAFRAVPGAGGFSLLEALFQGRDPELGQWLARGKRRLEKALAGMASGSAAGQEEQNRLTRELALVEAGLKEVMKW